MTNNDYQRGVADILKALGTTLHWTGTVTERANASSAGKRLADLYLLEGNGLTVDEFLSSLWSEMGKAYPKKVGLALIAKGLNPDPEEPRFEFMRGFQSRLEQRASDSSPA